jgi:molybdopterin-guanine dinucleotide biosynthesis protein A
MPFLTAAFVDAMFWALGDADVALPFVGGHLEPLAGVYRRATVLPAVEALVAAGRLRTLDLFESLHGVRVPEAVLRAADPDLGSLENLNGPEAYFPLVTPNGRVLLCSKAQVREVHFTFDGVDALAWTIGTPVSVSIGLDDGRLVSGTLLLEVESARQRVLDFLNRHPGRFLPVHSSNDVVLINRDHIVHVEQVA